MYLSLLGRKKSIDERQNTNARISVAINFYPISKSAFQTPKWQSQSQIGAIPIGKNKFQQSIWPLNGVVKLQKKKHITWNNLPWFMLQSTVHITEDEVDC